MAQQLPKKAEQKSVVSKAVGGTFLNDNDDEDMEDGEDGAMSYYSSGETFFVVLYCVRFRQWLE